MIQKSFNKTPSLYLISTPIGNLEDITLRAINTLKMVDVIFSEDTRVTQKLLNHLDIKKQLISNHNFNEKQNQDRLLKYLKEGKNVGLVSDRGTPIISDPGYNLTKCAIDNSYNVIAIPGVTAFVPALITSGINPNPFLFYGFLSDKENKQKTELEKLKELPYTLIFYESPHRIIKTLKVMSKTLGNRTISISREISKKFEEIFRGKITDSLDEITIKGEFVIVIEQNKEKTTYNNLTVIEHVNLYLKENYQINEAIKKVSIDRGTTKNIIYKEYHNIKKDDE